MKDVEEMTYKEQCDWMAGMLILAIGRGDFHATLVSNIGYHMKIAYDKGRRDEKEVNKK